MSGRYRRRTRNFLGCLEAVPKSILLIIGLLVSALTFFGLILLIPVRVAYASSWGWLAGSSGIPRPNFSSPLAAHHSKKMRPDRVGVCELRSRARLVCRRRYLRGSRSSAGVETGRICSPQRSERYQLPYFFGLDSCLVGRKQ